MDDKGILGSLFDFSFSHFVTPKLQRLAYRLLVVLAGVVAAGVLLAALVAAPGLLGKVGALVVGLPLAAVAFLVQVTLLRMGMELVILAFRAVDFLREASTHTRTLATSAEGALLRMSAASAGADPGAGGHPVSTEEERRPGAGPAPARS
jgi:hypothetical protein